MARTRRGAVRPLLRHGRRDAAVRGCWPAPTAGAPATSHSSASIWPNVLAALDWIDRYGDRDGDGFVEYARRSEHGLVQQGWKDSHDSVFHADGALADAPIALCEVQGYVYEAKQQRRRAGGGAGQSPNSRRAGATQAQTLRTPLPAAPSGARTSALYAMALDGEKRPCRVASSNAGHALWTGIASPEHARAHGAALAGSGLLHRLGHPHDRRADSRATTRCRITTARSGRTTTRSSPWAWPATATPTRP